MLNVREFLNPESRCDCSSCVFDISKLHDKTDLYSLRWRCFFDSNDDNDNTSTMFYGIERGIKEDILDYLHQFKDIISSIIYNLKYKTCVGDCYNEHFDLQVSTIKSINSVFLIDYESPFKFKSKAKFDIWDEQKLKNLVNIIEEFISDFVGKAMLDE